MFFNLNLTDTCNTQQEVGISMIATGTAMLTVGIAYNQYAKTHPDLHIPMTESWILVPIPIIVSGFVVTFQ